MRRGGGNRGINKEFTRAPQEENCEYRVIGVDTFDGGDWVQGDFETLEEAERMARLQGGSMIKMHIYDKDGNHVLDYGVF